MTKDLLDGLNLVRESRAKTSSQEDSIVQISSRTLREKASALYERGRQDERARLHREKTSAHRDLTTFAGQVFAHAFASESIQMKISAGKGDCITCHKNPAPSGDECESCMEKGD